MKLLINQLLADRELTLAIASILSKIDPEPVESPDAPAVRRLDGEPQRLTRSSFNLGETLVVRRYSGTRGDTPTDEEYTVTLLDDGFVEVSPPWRNSAGELLDRLKLPFAHARVVGVVQG